MMTRDWDFNIEERDAEFRDDLRAATGIGRKRRKVRQHPILSYNESYTSNREAANQAPSYPSKLKP